MARSKLCRPWHLLLMATVTLSQAVRVMHTSASIAPEPASPAANAEGVTDFDVVAGDENIPPKNGLERSQVLSQDTPEKLAVTKVGAPEDVGMNSVPEAEVLQNSGHSDMSERAGSGESNLVEASGCRKNVFEKSVDNTGSPGVQPSSSGEAEDSRDSCGISTSPVRGEVAKADDLSDLTASSSGDVAPRESRNRELAQSSLVSGSGGVMPLSSSPGDGATGLTEALMTKSEARQTPSMPNAAGGRRPSVLQLEEQSGGSVGVSDGAVDDTEDSITDEDSDGVSDGAVDDTEDSITDEDSGDESDGGEAGDSIPVSHDARAAKVSEKGVPAEVVNHKPITALTRGSTSAMIGPQGNLGTERHDARNQSRAKQDGVMATGGIPTPSPVPSGATGESKTMFQSAQLLNSGSPSSVMRPEKNVGGPVHDARTHRRAEQAGVVASGNTQRPSFLPSVVREQSQQVQRSARVLENGASLVMAPDNNMRLVEHDMRVQGRAGQAIGGAARSVEQSPLAPADVAEQSRAAVEGERRRQALHDARLTEQNRDTSEDTVVKQNAGQTTNESSEEKKEVSKDGPDAVNGDSAEQAKPLPGKKKNKKMDTDVKEEQEEQEEPQKGAAQRGFPSWAVVSSFVLVATAQLLV